MEPYVMNDYAKKDLEEKLRMIQSGEVSFHSWEEAEAQARLFEQAEREYQASLMGMPESSEPSPNTDAVGTTKQRC